MDAARPLSLSAMTLPSSTLGVSVVWFFIKRHLRIKQGTEGKELWCIYRKSKGGKKEKEQNQDNSTHYLLLMKMESLLIGNYKAE